MLSRVRSPYHHVGQTTSNRSNCRRKEEAVWKSYPATNPDCIQKTKPTHCRIKCTPWLSRFHQNCLSRDPNLWSLVPMPRVSFIGANNANLGLWTTWNMYCFLMSPPTLSFPHPWELRCGESSKRLNTWTVASDVLGCNWAVLIERIMPRSTEPFMCT